MNTTFENINLIKQERILSEAFAEFAEHGYTEASTNRLVKKLGISKGSLFKYFNSKLELYSYLVDISLHHLISYMDQFKPSECVSLKENIIAYAAFEYDYLIASPDKYHFFYQFVKDLNRPELVSIKATLLQRAYDVSNQLMNKINMPEDTDLREHILLIISAYNQSFIDQMDNETDWESIKPDYLSGLSKHLSYVNWRLI